MGFVGGLLGTAGGVAGTGISGPQSASIASPTTPEQAEAQYTVAQEALMRQRALVDAVNAQNGIGNQSTVFNQLQGVANGTGPNPAQAQLAQATGANVANQAALMASQRGASANPALIARLAAQQGAQTQQQSAGQAATLQAQQSLNALNNMGNLATNQANQQASAIQGYNQAAQGEQSNVLNAIQGQNMANVQNQGSVNQGNTALASGVMGGQRDLLGNITKGAGGAFGLAEGGEVPMNAQPIITKPSPTPQAQPGPMSRVGKMFHSMMETSSSSDQGLTGASQAGNVIGQGIGSALSSMFNPNGATGTATNRTDEQAMEDRTSADALLSTPGVSKEMDLPALLGMGMPMAAKGGKVPALVSPGETYLPPKKVNEVKKGANPLDIGERIPGKPKHPGNDYRNDTVPKELEAGGVVIPNSIMQSKDAAKKAAKFVEAVLAKHGKPGLKKSK